MSEKQKAEAGLRTYYLLGAPGCTDPVAVFVDRDEAERRMAFWVEPGSLIPVVPQAAFDAERERADQLQRQLADKKLENAQLKIKIRGADRVADEVASLVTRRILDARSAVADALLDYRDPPRNERSDRIADLEEQLAEATDRAEQVEAAFEELRKWQHNELPKIFAERSATREQAEADCAGLREALHDLRAAYVVSDEHSMADCARDIVTAWERVDRLLGNEKSNPGAAILAERDKLAAILREAIDLYGKPGGPWNVPSDPGGWLARAREALGGVPATKQPRAAINWRPGPAQGAKDSPCDGDAILCAFNLKASWCLSLLAFVIDDIDETQAVGCLNEMDGEASEWDWNDVALWVPASELLPKAESEAR